MPSACGIHVDRRRFRVVVLDGGPKKHRVVAHTSGEIPSGADPAEHLSHELRRFSKEKKVSPENVGLAVDSGLAAFRTLTLPFDDREKIEEVLKFEVESELPQWSIDDVVVDFLLTDSKPGVESTLLVTALPKERLAAQISACESAGLEPVDAELDGTALFNAASLAGLLDPESAQLLVLLGDTTTTVVVADGGRLRTMRAIRAGTVPTGTAAEAPGGEVAEGEEETLVPEVEQDPEEVARRLELSVQRIRRELVRTVSSARTTHPIAAVHLFGNALPGLDEELLLDVPVDRPQALPDLGPDVDAGELVVAYGVALKQLGQVPLDGHLRREELRYSGKFERLELPLAVFSILLTALLGVKLIVTRQQLLWRDRGDVSSWSSDQPLVGDMQMWLNASNAYMLPDAERGYPGRVKKPPEGLQKYAQEVEKGADSQGRGPYQELLETKRRILLEINGLQKDLGISADTASEIPQPQSALRATTLVLGVLSDLGPDVGRYGIRALQADSQNGRSLQDQSVTIKLDMDFFAESAVKATANYTNFVNALKSKPWCKEFTRRAVDSFGDKGVSIDGLQVEVDVSKVQPGDEQGPAEGEDQA